MFTLVELGRKIFCYLNFQTISGLDVWFCCLLEAWCSLDQLFTQLGVTLVSCSSFSLLLERGLYPCDKCNMLMTAQITYPAMQPLRSALLFSETGLTVRLTLKETNYLRKLLSGFTEFTTDLNDSRPPVCRCSELAFWASPCLLFFCDDEVEDSLLSLFYSILGRTYNHNYKSSCLFFNQSKMQMFYSTSDRPYWLLLF